MKWLHNLFDSFRPHFESRGTLATLKPLFEAIEYIFILPAARTENAPHVRDPMDLKRYMTIVIVALMPCILSAVYFFGPRVLLMILVSYVVGGIVEVCFACIRKTEVHEGFFVTGMIFSIAPSTSNSTVGCGCRYFLRRILWKRGIRRDRTQYLQPGSRWKTLRNNSLPDNFDQRLDSSRSMARCSRCCYLGHPHGHGQNPGYPDIFS